MAVYNVGSIPGKRGFGAPAGQGMLSGYLQETERRQQEAQRMKQMQETEAQRLQVRGESRGDLLESPEYRKQQFELDQATKKEQVIQKVISENPELEGPIRLNLYTDDIKAKLADAYNQLVVAKKPLEDQATFKGVLAGKQTAATTVATATPEALEATQQTTDAGQSTADKSLKESQAGYYSSQKALEENKQIQGELEYLKSEAPLKRAQEELYRAQAKYYRSGGASSGSTPDTYDEKDAINQLNDLLVKYLNADNLIDDSNMRSEDSFKFSDTFLSGAFANMELGNMTPENKMKATEMLMPALRRSAKTIATWDGGVPDPKVVEIFAKQAMQMLQLNPGAAEDVADAIMDVKAYIANPAIQEVRSYLQQINAAIKELQAEGAK